MTWIECFLVIVGAVVLMALVAIGPVIVLAGALSKWAPKGGKA